MLVNAGNYILFELIIQVVASTGVLSVRAITPEEPNGYTTIDAHHWGILTTCGWMRVRVRRKR